MQYQNAFAPLFDCIVNELSPKKPAHTTPHTCCRSGRDAPHDYEADGAQQQTVEP